MFKILDFNVKNGTNLLDLQLRVNKIIFLQLKKTDDICREVVTSRDAVYKSLQLPVELHVDRFSRLAANTS